MLSMRQSPCTSAIRPSSAGTLSASQAMRRSMSSIFLRFAGPVLIGPALVLTGVVAARLAVIREARRGDVDHVQFGEALVHRVIDRPTVLALEFRQRRIPEDAAVDEGHEIEGGSDHALVLAERKRARGRIADALERLEHPKLALDHVGHFEELARRLAAQHVAAVRRLDEIGRVRLAGGEFLRRRSGRASPRHERWPMRRARACILREGAAHRAAASLV